MYPGILPIVAEVDDTPKTIAGKAIVFYMEYRKTIFEDLEENDYDDCTAYYASLQVMVRFMDSIIDNSSAFTESELNLIHASFYEAEDGSIKYHPGSINLLSLSFGSN